MYVPSGHKNSDQHPNSAPAPDRMILITSIVVIVIVVTAVGLVIALRTKKRRKTKLWKTKIRNQQDGSLYE
jgi:multisubunit Na+/H+ antiporter MnhC subunit